MKYKYKFSVIVPIYNVEDYLEETLDSVVNQTIGFKENIQLILVNDGSPDNSEKICLKYKEEYPDNIIYIAKENGGVSSARNKGIEYIEGKYVNFLDSDDKWDLNAFKEIYKFFEDHYDEVDIVGCKLKLFEASTAIHPLDYKFDKNKIVDIFDKYDHIQLHVSSSILKSSALKKSKLKFNESLKYSEDACFLIEFALISEKIGLISSINYNYRKRFSENSALQTKNKSEDWYLKTPILCHKYLIDLSKKKYGYVIPYIQYFIMYEYQWRVKEMIPSNISQNIINEYISFSKEILNYIDDNIILFQKRLLPEFKVQTLNFKYGKEIFDDLKYDNHSLLFNNLDILNLTSSGILKLNVMNFNEEFLELKGFVTLYLPSKDYKINVVINNKIRCELKLIETDNNPKKFFNQQFLTNKGFSINISTLGLQSIHFELVYKDNYRTNLNFDTGINAKVDSKFKSYYIHNNQLYYYYNKKIKVRNKTLKNRIRFSLRMYFNLLKEKKFKTMVYRFTYSFLKLFKHKEIWLISDRTMVANDNGIHLFKYICKQKDKKIKPYFVISKSSKDYEKMKKIGKVLNYNSIKYKLYFLLSDKIISSQADSWVTNAFNKSVRYYHDLYNYKFIFLQHGITKDDLSSWLNAYDKNIRIFVTSANEEYKSIINEKYGYSKSEVKLTGFPRYDNLTNKPEKIITIMPTWRQLLSGQTNRAKGKIDYNPNFKESEYFKFYNTLINDKSLLEVMNKKGYKGLFVIHPMHVDNYKDFDGNETIEVVNGFADYQEIFKKSKLMISDYSSVPFDFAYLNKPVIYTQFDKEDFFSSHTYSEGYFSYEEDGFGPVVYDYENTVQEIIKYIENDCKIENKYLKRIEKFYKYHDRNNCKRVYEEIKKI